MIKAITSFSEFEEFRARAQALARQIVEDLSPGLSGGDIESARGAVTELRTLVARLAEWYK